FGKVRFVLAVLFGTFFAHAADLSLGPPVYRDGRFYFEVHGESKASYIVLSTTNLSDWTPLFTNEAATAVNTFDCPAPHDRAFFRVQRLPLPLFRFALLAAETIEL